MNIKEDRFKFIIIILSLILIFIVLSFLILFNIKIVKHPLKKHIGTSIEVKVKKGDSFYSVIDKLDKMGVLNNAKMSKLYIRCSKVDPSDIRAGDYIIASDISMKGIIEKLGGNESITTVTVTIPEGKNIEEIADILDSKGVISKNKFLSSCDKYELPPYIKSNLKRRYELEGYLFPDTYEFNKNATANEIIKTMLDRFEFILKDIQINSNKLVNNEDIDDLIIMASIVEKEISFKEERAKAASVFYNRLNLGMKLQSCATVQYALGEHRDKLYNKDLNINSPYNTYKVGKLPIGPICCPGRASIEAALNPQNTNYIYFVSKNDGTHIFTDNYKDFIEAKKKYQGED